jgi:protein-S-isoprenylcysteine O-methyltransferase Ste14
MLNVTANAGVAMRTLVGFAQLILVLGVAIFGPAWTLDYWQGWLYLVVFAGSAAAITAYLSGTDPALLQRRLSGGPLAEHATTQKLIQLVAGVSFIAVFVISSLDHRLSWSTVPTPLVLIANVVVVVGFAIVWRVFKENTYTAATIEVAAEQTVVSSGPYALVRHPMYVGALLMLLATPVALGSFWGVLMFIPLLAAIVWRLADEERFLTTHLSGYDAYRRQVRYRLIPLIW